MKPLQHNEDLGLEGEHEYGHYHDYDSFSWDDDASYDDIPHDDTCCDPASLVDGGDGRIDTKIDKNEKRKEHEKPYYCEECDKGCNRPYEMERHIQTGKKHRKSPSEFVCQFCWKEFSRKDSLGVCTLLILPDDLHRDIRGTPAELRGKMAVMTDRISDCDRKSYEMILDNHWNLSWSLVCLKRIETDNTVVCLISVVIHSVGV